MWRKNAEARDCLDRRQTCFIIVICSCDVSHSCEEMMTHTFLHQLLRVAISAGGGHVGWDGVFYLSLIIVVWSLRHFVLISLVRGLAFDLFVSFTFL